MLKREGGRAFLRVCVDVCVVVQISARAFLCLFRQFVARFDIVPLQGKEKEGK